MWTGRAMWPWVGRMLAALLALLLGFEPALAQNIRTLRDAEMEDFLHEIMRPVFIAAGVTPESVQFVIVDDPSLNAFYAGGTAIFLHTGVFLQTDNVNQVIGVLAHETGHMTGGHVQRFDEIAAPATAMSILGLLLGAAAIAAGAPADAGVGIITGGQTAAQRTALKFRRVQEASADQAAAQFLQNAKLSGKGLIEVFEKFRFEQLMVAPNLDPYIVSHPLSSDRIAHLEERLKASPYWDKPVDPAAEARYERIKAKLIGYIFPAKATLGRYPASDRSVPARYARIYAYNKMMEWDEAMAEADSLIAEDPSDPYFREIKGQILLENGHVDEAIPELAKAAEYAPHQTLILTLYGQALAAKEEPETDAKAAEVLERAAALDPHNAFAWYLLATIYTRDGKQPLADLAAAERFLLMQNVQQAAAFASRAAEKLPAGTPKWYRAQDIRQIAGGMLLDSDGRDRRSRRQ
ncbi:MAG: M48 family metalloprotease [Rhodothalassiaceae bacterium]